MTALKIGIMFGIIKTVLGEIEDDNW